MCHRCHPCQSSLQRAATVRLMETVTIEPQGIDAERAVVQVQNRTIKYVAERRIYLASTPRAKSSDSSSTTDRYASTPGARTRVPGGRGTVHSASGMPSACVNSPDDVTHGAAGQISAPSDRAFAAWMSA